MKITCWYCHKGISTELPDTTVFRGLAICPECLSEPTDEQLPEQKKLEETNE